jgi:hypothetical protein
MQSDAEMVSHHSTSPPSLSAAAAGAEQRDERKRGEASSSSFSSSSAGGGGGEHRDERWWRRSPLKAIGAMLTPCTLTLDDSPMQPSVPQLLAADAAHALAHTPKATSLPASFESVYTREREPEREASSLLVGFACPVSPMPTSTGTPRPPPQVTEP